MIADFYMKHNDEESDLECFGSVQGFEKKQKQQLKEFAEIMLELILFPLNLVKLSHVLHTLQLTHLLKLSKKMTRNSRANPFKSLAEVILLLKTQYPTFT